MNINNNDLENFTNNDAKKWSIIALLFGAIIYFFIQKYVNIDRAAIAAMFVSIIIILIRYFSRLTKKIWFWCLVVFILIVEGAIVFLVPMGRWPGSFVILTPTAIIDFYTTFLLVYTLDKKFSNGNEK